MVIQIFLSDVNWVDRHDDHLAWRRYLVPFGKKTAVEVHALCTESAAALDDDDNGARDRSHSVAWDKVEYVTSSIQDSR